MKTLYKDLIIIIQIFNLIIRADGYLCLIAGEYVVVEDRILLSST